jgi:hypothetical protein
MFENPPKSRNHYLLMPRARFQTLEVLGRDQLPVLIKMKEEVNRITGSVLKKYFIMNAGFFLKSFNDVSFFQRSIDSFRIGFHAIPSMSQLHLHLISSDFLGSGLKNKKHYNSFTTPFLISIDEAITALSVHGKIKVR